MAVKITRDILESYLHCKTKGHLKLSGEQGTRSDYEALLLDLRGEIRLRALNKILAQDEDEYVAKIVPMKTHSLKRGPAFVLDTIVEDDSLCLVFDGLKRVDGPSKLGDFHYVPVIFHEGRKVRKEERLLLEVYALLLGQLQGRMPGYGVIWHGRESKGTRVKVNLDQRKAEQVLRDLRKMLGGGSPPSLILNDHCHVCEFRKRCHAQAVQEDNISLLRRMGEKEVTRYARKGIFTVTQLSCTFRLRKRGKRVRNQQRPHYFALQALAVREKKTYVLGTPTLPGSPVRMYLDCEGDPERGFIYLIGISIVEDKDVKHYSFWADSETEERGIFQQFLETVSRYPGFTLFHYGSYERLFLKRMRRERGWKELVDRVLANSCNVLSLIHSGVYFPTYSNGLKEVGAYLGCTWSEGNASGAQSVVWRKEWESNYEQATKRKLITYNSEDCVALRRVTECIAKIVSGTATDGGQTANGGSPPNVARAEDIPSSTSRREFGRAQFVFPELKYVNQCAYFDYQREKVFLRTNKMLKRVHARKKSRQTKKEKVNRKIIVKSLRCPFCQGRDVKRYPDKMHSKLAYDLRITDGGIRRTVIECSTALHRCTGCQRDFLPPLYKRRDKHLHALKCWAMYQHVAHRVSFQRMEQMLKEFFGLHVLYTELHMFKALMARRYRPTVRKILAKLTAGHVIHADETQANLQKEKGYVWVLANMEEVLYFYKPTREGDFLHGLLGDFAGVLVTDFFSAYDSLQCEQQKCLVHLIRDMNHDLLNNPFDDEFKSLVREFGQLLQTIVVTIDKFGLKKRHLNKHRNGVARFFRVLAGRHFNSDLAQSYQERLTRNQNKLFTFLKHDSVPWNNNNAEHALRHYAHYRQLVDGQMTASGLSDYLVLLSIYQSCNYKGVSFLKFLLSRERDIDRFIEARGKRRRNSSLEPYPEGFMSNHPRRRGDRNRKSSSEATCQAPESPQGG